MTDCISLGSALTRWTQSVMLSCHAPAVKGTVCRRHRRRVLG